MLQLLYTRGELYDDPLAQGMRPLLLLGFGMSETSSSGAHLLQTNVRSIFSEVLLRNAFF
jgi:hypothetical protein